jgi:hypothetical protein
MSFAEVLTKELRVIPVTIRHELAEAGIPTSVTPLDSEVSHRMSDLISEADIERQLAQEGLIQMPAYSRQQQKPIRRINVEGKPLSELIIEERR